MSGPVVSHVQWVGDICRSVPTLLRTLLPDALPCLPAVLVDIVWRFGEATSVACYIVSLEFSFVPRYGPAGGSVQVEWLRGSVVTLSQRTCSTAAGWSAVVEEVSSLEQFHTLFLDEAFACQPGDDADGETFLCVTCIRGPGHTGEFRVAMWAGANLKQACRLYQWPFATHAVWTARHVSLGCTFICAGTPEGFKEVLAFDWTTERVTLRVPMVSGSSLMHCVGSADLLVQVSLCALHTSVRSHLGDRPRTHTCKQELFGPTEALEPPVALRYDQATSCVACLHRTLSGTCVLVIEVPLAGPEDE